MYNHLEPNCHSCNHIEKSKCKIGLAKQSKHIELILKIITFILQLLVTVDVPDPMLNAKSLQASDESKYTRNRTCKNIHIVYYYLSKYVIIYDTRSLDKSLINVHSYKLFHIFSKLPTT